MPDRTIDLLFRFLHQNNGTLSKRAREQEFANLTDGEAAAAEEADPEIFQPTAGTVNDCDRERRRRELVANALCPYLEMRPYLHELNERAADARQTIEGSGAVASGKRQKGHLVPSKIPFNPRG
jgi:hypothetical protein